MEVNDNSKRSKMRRARKRIEELKGFYWHLASYLAVNLVISIFKITRNLGDGETFSEAFFDFGTFAIWFFWGIGLFFHGVKVFGTIPIFGKGWEERQIQKYIEQERKEAEKYK
ncbi:MAG: 2TM domain-containing protein [Aurantibacter sp.]